MDSRAAEIGIEAAPPRRPRPLLAPALCLTLLCAGGASFYRARGAGQLIACQSNLQTVQSALILYAGEHRGRLPARLDETSFKSYMPLIPTCPAAGRDTYGYETDGSAFTLCCRGDHHRHFLPDLETADRPRVTYGSRETSAPEQESDH